METYKDTVDLQIEHTNQMIDFDKYRKDESWIIIGKKEAIVYRYKILETLDLKGLAKVIAVGHAINKLWITLNHLLLKYKDKIRIKQIQIDIQRSDQGKPVAILRTILQRR